MMMVILFLNPGLLWMVSQLDNNMEMILTRKLLVDKIGNMDNMDKMDKMDKMDMLEKIDK